MQKGYVDQYGLHHWWLDCDEPCGGTNNGSYATDWLYHNGAGAAWPAAFVGSAYPQMLDIAVYEGEGAPGKKYEHDNVMLGRSAWAGSQRYGGPSNHPPACCLWSALSFGQLGYLSSTTETACRSGVFSAHRCGVVGGYQVDVGGLQPAVPRRPQHGHER